MAPDKDEKLGHELVDEMQRFFQKHDGYRTTHAKGIMLDGHFTPTAEAGKLSVAPHFNHHSTPILARFSVGTGFPTISDTDPNAVPKGIAIRFKCGHGVHTDIITHSKNGFPVSTGEAFLELLKVGRENRDNPGDASKAALQKFLQKNPTAAAAFTEVKPNPVGYSTSMYYATITHKLIDAHGKETNMRYRVVPEDGVHDLTDEESKAKSANYLRAELPDRLEKGPIVFHLEAQIPGPDDVLDNATIPYKNQEFIPLGTIKLEKLSHNNVHKQQQMWFDPVPSGVKGVAPSDDPLLNTRWHVYEISANQREHAKALPETNLCSNS